MSGEAQSVAIVDSSRRVGMPRAASLAFGAAFLASFLLARAHPFGNAHMYEAEARRRVALEQVPIPAAPRAILIAKCADCHSMQTHVPFYGHLAPASWLMEKDIVDGRQEFRMDIWESYSADKQQALVANIVQRTRKGEMPPIQYRIIHRNARVTEAEEQVLTDWAQASLTTKAPPR